MPPLNDLPGYLWVIELIGVTGIAATPCVLLYAGARRAGAGRGPATLLATATAVVLGGWFATSAVIAAGGGYQSQLGDGIPWLPVAVLGELAALLALGRIPAVTRALDRLDMTGPLLIPHTFRVAGVVFLAAMVLGRMPALFALPAGLGDIATGIGAAVVARRLSRDPGAQGARSVHVFGTIDLVVALTVGAVTGFQLFNAPANELIGALPFALIPTAAVPLLLALHIRSLSTLRKARRTTSAARGTLAGRTATTPARTSLT